MTQSYKERQKRIKKWEELAASMAIDGPIPMRFLIVKEYSAEGRYKVFVTGEMITPDIKHGHPIPIEAGISAGGNTETYIAKPSKKRFIQVAKDLYDHEVEERISYKGRRFVHPHRKKR